MAYSLMRFGELRLPLLRLASFLAALLETGCWLLGESAPLLRASLRRRCCNLIGLADRKATMNAWVSPWDCHGSRPVVAMGTGEPVATVKIK